MMTAECAMKGCLRRICGLGAAKLWDRWRRRLGSLVVGRCASVVDKAERNRYGRVEQPVLGCCCHEQLGAVGTSLIQIWDHKSAQAFMGRSPQSFPASHVVQPPRSLYLPDSSIVLLYMGGNVPRQSLY